MLAALLGLRQEDALPYDPLVRGGVELIGSACDFAGRLLSGSASSARPLTDRARIDLPENGFGAEATAARLSALAEEGVDSARTIRDECRRWILDLVDLPQISDVRILDSARSATAGAIESAIAAFDARPETVSLFASGLLNGSTREAAALAGLPETHLRVSAEADSPFDLKRLDADLGSCRGPAIVIVTAGEERTGAFDQVADAVAVATRAGAWSHVDATAGLGGRVCSRVASRMTGIKGADSVCGDLTAWLAHGFRATLLTFRLPHAPQRTEVPADPAQLEASLRLWASMYAYGRNGHREVIERLLDSAASFFARLEASRAAHLLAPILLPRVCFSFPELNESIGEASRDSTAARAVPTMRRVSWLGTPAFSAAFEDWRIEPAGMEAAADELISRMSEGGRVRAPIRRSASGRAGVRRTP